MTDENEQQINRIENGTAHNPSRRNILKGAAAGAAALGTIGAATLGGTSAFAAAGPDPKMLASSLNC